MVELVEALAWYACRLRSRWMSVQTRSGSGGVAHLANIGPVPLCRHFATAASISAAPIDYNQACGPARHDTGHLMYFREPVRRVGEMELTFSCPNCGVVGHVSPLEGATEAGCRHCGTDPGAQAGGDLGRANCSPARGA